jgi:hypothetical protein
MSGWPSRILRAALGPVLSDARPVEHPEHEWASAHIELLKHQAAGHALISPRVVCLAEWTGSAFDIHWQAEAWNPRNELAHPVLARTSTGVYTYTFPTAAAEDLDGNSVPLNLKYGRCAVCPADPVGTTQPLQADVIDRGTTPASFQLELVNGSSTAIDEPFWLEIF